MIRNILSVALGSAAIVIAGPALAAPGGGGGPSANANVNAGAHAGGPSQAGIDARANSQGAVNASPNGVLNSNTNSALHTNTTPTTKATNSQGLQNASPNGIAHASPNSVLARGAVASSALPGLATGMTVNNSGGTSIGTVSRVVTDSSGNIRLVIVTSPTGQTYRLAPNTLSISGSVVTTTSM